MTGDLTNDRHDDGNVLHCNKKRLDQSKACRRDVSSLKIINEPKIESSKHEDFELKMLIFIK